MLTKDQAQFQVEYVRSHVRSDIGFNERSNGSGYHPVFGRILEHYLRHVDYFTLDGEKYLEDFVIFGLSELEQVILDRTAKKIDFIEVRKCGYAINQFWFDIYLGRGEFQKELDEIKKYAKELRLNASEADKDVNVITKDFLRSLHRVIVQKLAQGL